MKKLTDQCSCVLNHGFQPHKGADTFVRENFSVSHTGVRSDSALLNLIQQVPMNYWYFTD
ncbi:hypothetical protein BFW38_12355 [Terasakiispira papahanaumokuakeensis]|uniref:Uncharacterized protein n=1 Tax=Terasakiispira papahanaumokuakeensis TaxID=197479 RepID=A0A1E2VBA4_9GAMM|nr:hypothetical protein BFW38_12355 [Terasakiispira papahanaumokuakeensis]